MTDNHRWINREANIKKRAKNMPTCKKEGCNRKSEYECMDYCRSHFIDDMPYESSSVRSTLSGI
jgi:hypothetical protein